jgi:hypothetical protein
MAYASASDVSMLCRNLVGAASGFDTSTSPTLAQVNVWLSSGCAQINSVIGSRGYGAIPATSAAYQFASDANAQFAAMRAEQSRINARIAPGERTRADKFKQGFDDAIKELKMLDLSRLGVGADSQVYAGGISISDRDNVEADNDRVQSRFVRGMFRNREAVEPIGTGAGDSQSHEDS